MGLIKTKWSRTVFTPGTFSAATTNAGRSRWSLIVPQSSTIPYSNQQAGAAKRWCCSGAKGAPRSGWSYRYRMKYGQSRSAPRDRCVLQRHHSALTFLVSSPVHLLTRQYGCCLAAWSRPSSEWWDCCGEKAKSKWGATQDDWHRDQHRGTRRFPRKEVVLQIPDGALDSASSGTFRSRGFTFGV